jgi:hypothetical protein
MTRVEANIGTKTCLSLAVQGVQPCADSGLTGDRTVRRPGEGAIKLDKKHHDRASWNRGTALAVSEKREEKHETAAKVVDDAE